MKERQRETVTEDTERKAENIERERGEKKSESDEQRQRKTKRQKDRGTERETCSLRALIVAL